MDKVLVTGATGFIGLHCIEQLLRGGYFVRGTVRTESRGAEVINAMEQADLDASRLEIVCADLLKDEGWPAAIEGCRYVLHVASPFVLEEPKDEDELIKPAVEGTLRVLKACPGSTVEKVVLTSSFAAVGYGNTAKTMFNEDDWSDPQLCSAYPKSKTLAERAAWAFMADLPERDKFALTVLNPVAVTGPMLSDDIGTSNDLLLQLASGAMPACPKIHMGFVDVRDVAKAHVSAMTDQHTNGERIILSENEMFFSSMGGLLKAAGFVKAPTRDIPNFLVRFAALFSDQLRSTLPFLGRISDIDKSRAKRHFAWTFVSAERSAQETMEQLQKMRRL
jgi:dihydroflavonol-4-reductase